MLLLLLALQFPLVKMRVEGASRIPSDAVLAATQLRLGQTVTPADFETACQTLMATGIFQSCRFSYPGGSGFDLTFQIAEMPAREGVRFCIPAVDEAAMWEWMAQHDGLIQKRIPGTKEASDYYLRAVNQYLAEVKRSEPISAMESAAAGAMTVTFQPTNLPVVTDIAFQGNRAFSSQVLVQTVGPLVLGRGGTECDVRTIVNLNVRPLYEKRGFLNVQFPGVAAQGTAFRVTVEEGHTYNLRAVQFTSDSLPEKSLLDVARFNLGKLAEWDKIEESVDRMASYMRGLGYLHAFVQPQRALSEEAGGVADLTIAIRPGPRFTFGELRLEGLDAESARRARLLWKLQPGAAMDGNYSREYLKSLFESRILPASVKSVADRTEIRPQTQVADVVIVFR